MKRTIALLLLLASCAPLPLASLEVPQLKGRVNDYAGMLSPATVAAIETKLADFEKAESTQVAVLTITSLEGEVLEEYSMKVAESWKIGRKKLDNGVILLVARDDRKLRIEVGYGLEGKLTDLRAGRIIDYIIVPKFKGGDFDGGVSDGVDAIMQTVRGEFQAVDNARPPANDSRSLLVPALIAFIFIGIIGKARRILGGIAGAVIIPIVAGVVLGFSLFLLALIPIGFIAGLIIPTLMTTFMMSGGGGGGWSGSGSGGFSGGGGGFGGGGASGGW